MADKTLRIAAFDPGITGGIAIYSSGDYLVKEMPVFSSKKGKKKINILDCTAISTILVDYSVEKIYLEDVNAAPHQGVVSMFNFGKGLGQLIGMIQTLGLPYEKIRPIEWKKYHKLLKCDKKASIAKVAQILPNVDVPTSSRGNRHEGASEALLILEYAKEINK
tara:strand:+ start:939 stop:1430 length:492 start_codon:yes stop_codon:yes gene_type:complete